jgi:hypothetical protein
MESATFQKWLLAFAILTSVTRPSVSAETPEARQACTNDANSYCADEVPDRERVYACLVRNVNQLSPPCKKIINESIAPPQRRR